MQVQLGLLAKPSGRRCLKTSTIFHPRSLMMVDRTGCTENWERWPWRDHRSERKSDAGFVSLILQSQVSPQVVIAISVRFLYKNAGRACPFFVKRSHVRYSRSRNVSSTTLETTATIHSGRASHNLRDTCLARTLRYPSMRYITTTRKSPNGNSLGEQGRLPTETVTSMSKIIAPSH